MPGNGLDQPYAQCPGLAGSHAPGAGGRLVDSMKNSSRIFQENLSGCAELYSSGKPVEEFESNFFFQILDLT